MSSFQIILLIYALVGLASGMSLAWEGSRRNTLEAEFLPLSNLLIWLTRILVGALFLYSGFVKANDYIGFGYKLEEYFQVFGTDFPALAGFFELFVPMAQGLAWFISVFEIALGVALIVGWKPNLTLWLTLLMMIFFTLLTGYSHFTGAVTDCGCFGDALKIEPWESFVKDIILTLVLVPVFLVRKHLRALPNARIAGWITAAAFVLSGIYSYYCHEHLPMIDYRAYKVGTDLEICTTVIQEGDDFPKCNDWGQFYDEYPLFEGKVLMIVMYKVEKAEAEAIAQSKVLADALADKGVKVYGATNSRKQDMEQSLIPQHQFNYPFTYLDEKVLKTIVRANPGYMLLNDGIVVKKWHHNDIPDTAEVLGLLP